jgi:hypothetical protein
MLFEIVLQEVLLLVVEPVVLKIVLSEKSESSDSLFVALLVGLVVVLVQDYLRCFISITPFGLMI